MAEEKKCWGLHPCHIISGFCLLFCYTAIAFLIAYPISLADQFTMPTVEVSSTQISRIDISTNNASLTVKVQALMKNPNVWPFGATISKLSAHVWSLGKGNETDVYFMNQANLSKPVAVGTNSEIKFDIDMDIVIKATVKNAPLFWRLNHDCGLLGPANEDGMKETKLRVKIGHSDGDVAGISADFEVSEKPVETLVTCGKAL